eukprot:TRINITY_DN689_c0_g1_i2.p1 TRINITY_DN689_c0_g1~~TRINITY_DN689_c0_g1_i2.p1  ORF type:complete len:309 (-),score=166.13 TRINITY_DN689_c0_g1_i2:249-1175(-)
MATFGIRSMNLIKHQNLSINNCSQILQNQSRSMAGLRELKLRIRSIGSVKKITASMKTVATSKLKPAEVRKDIANPFGQAGIAGLDVVGATNQKQNENDSIVILPITSDKGLCGAVNSAIIRNLQPILKTSKAQTPIVCVGDKSRQSLGKYLDQIQIVASQLDKRNLVFSDLIPIAEHIASLEFDKLIIGRNHFINLLSFETKVHCFSSPSQFAESEFSSFKLGKIKSKEDFHEYYTYALATYLYSAVVENSATELSARMTSMENATRNATEILGKITLQYNKKRQASITTEIIEIISGASAMQAASN